MKRTDFKDFNINNFLIKRNVNIKGDTFLRPDIHHMQFRKDEMAMYFRMKCYGESAVRKLNMAKRGESLEDLKAHTFKVWYSSELKISSENYNYLMAKLQDIPPLYYDFFKLLKHENQPKK